MVARVTVVVTAAAALAIAPAATILIRFLLPDFTPSLPALYIMLPAVVSLSLTQVLSSYVAGVGRSGWTSVVNVGALGVNVLANLVLIPLFGIAGAAAASLISYTASALGFSLMASRLSNRPLSDFWLPRWSDVRFTIVATVGMGRRVIRRPGGPA